MTRHIPVPTTVSPEAQAFLDMADLHVFEAMPHGGFFGAPEDEELAGERRHFLAVHLGAGPDPDRPDVRP